MSNYYEMLGVSENATKEEIKKAYWEVAKSVHPDTSSIGKADGGQKFKKITAIYTTLINPDTRAAYDAELSGINFNHTLTIQITEEDSRTLNAYFFEARMEAKHKNFERASIFLEAAASFANGLVQKGRMSEQERAVLRRHIAGSTKEYANAILDQGRPGHKISAATLFERASRHNSELGNANLAGSQVRKAESLRRGHYTDAYKKALAEMDFVAAAKALDTHLNIIDLGGNGLYWKETLINLKSAIVYAAFDEAVKFRPSHISPTMLFQRLSGEISSNLSSAYKDNIEKPYVDLMGKIAEHAGRLSLRSLYAETRESADNFIRESGEILGRIQSIGQIRSLRRRPNRRTFSV